MFSKKNSSTIDHEDDDIFLALVVSITFVDQKNGEKKERTTQESTGGLFMNASGQLSSLISALRIHPDSRNDAPICTCTDSRGNLRTFNRQQVLLHVPFTATTIGEDTLGFAPNGMVQK